MQPVLILFFQKNGPFFGFAKIHQKPTHKLFNKYLFISINKVYFGLLKYISSCSLSILLFTKHMDFRFPFPYRLNILERLSFYPANFFLRLISKLFFFMYNSDLNLIYVTVPSIYFMVVGCQYHDLTPSLISMYLVFPYRRSIIVSRY